MQGLRDSLRILNWETDEVHAYEELIVSGRTTAPHLARRLGWGDDRMRRVLARLEALGVAKELTEGEGGRKYFIAQNPEAVLRKVRHSLEEASERAIAETVELWEASSDPHRQPGHEALASAEARDIAIVGALEMAEQRVLILDYRLSWATKRTAPMLHKKREADVDVRIIGWESRLKELRLRERGIQCAAGPPAMEISMVMDDTVLVTQQGDVTSALMRNPGIADTLATSFDERWQQAINPVQHGQD